MEAGVQGEAMERRTRGKRSKAVHELQGRAGFHSIGHTALMRFSERGWVRRMAGTLMCDSRAPSFRNTSAELAGL